LAGAAVLGRLTWLEAALVSSREETPRVKTLVLEADGWGDHRAGQHLDVRLTAEDGYQAERSYSIASAPGEPLAITVERLEDGEVSPYLVDEAREGDRFEVRGPIGGYFVWNGDEPEPVLLVAGGSGVVPLAAIARQRARVGSQAPMKLLYSSRSWEDVIYRDELDRLGIEVVHTLTREQPPDWHGYARRIDDELLREVAFPVSERPRVYVCGSTRFVDAAADGLVRLGYDPLWVRTERFGATG
jgi:ferredoxin-NADP reductase